jgi:Nucleoside-diphosphate-sugar epimerases
MQNKAFVTGATGHLGSALTQSLSAQGYQVTAGVRDITKAKLNNNIAGKITHADLLKPETLSAAMDGSNIVFQVAANFSHWSKNSQRDIIQANSDMVKNIFDAAHDTSVKKIIFVSSTGTLARNTTGEIIPPNSWCENTYGNPYFQSKIETERLAWSLAEKYNIEMVSVLPSAMINSDLSHNTPTTRFLQSIFKGELLLDLEFNFNLVHVNDVSDAIARAGYAGKPSQRYILANPQGLSINDITRLAQQYNSAVKLPRRVGKKVLLFIATLAELSKYFNIEPKLLKSQIHFYFNQKENYDISLSSEHLNFSPRPMTACLHEYFSALSSFDPFLIQEL